ncbi:MAG: hypothetical protein WKG00_40710 [Polyangiaceae bacterium]
MDTARLAVRFEIQHELDARRYGRAGRASPELERCWRARAPYNGAGLSIDPS